MIQLRVNSTWRPKDDPRLDFFALFPELDRDACYIAGHEIRINAPEARALFAAAPAGTFTRVEYTPLKPHKAETVADDGLPPIEE